MPRKTKSFDLKKEVKAIARERVGPVPSTRPIEPKALRKKPKYKKQLDQEQP